MPKIVCQNGLFLLLKNPLFCSPLLLLQRKTIQLPIKIFEVTLDSFYDAETTVSQNIFIFSRTISTNKSITVWTVMTCFLHACHTTWNTCAAPAPNNKCTLYVKILIVKIDVPHKAQQNSNNPSCASWTWLYSCSYLTRTAWTCHRLRQWTNVVYSSNYSHLRNSCH